MISVAPLPTTICFLGIPVYQFKFPRSNKEFESGYSEIEFRCFFKYLFTPG